MYAPQQAQEKCPSTSTCPTLKKELISAIASDSRKLTSIRPLLKKQMDFEYWKFVPVSRLSKQECPTPWSHGKKQSASLVSLH